MTKATKQRVNVQRKKNEMLNSNQQQHQRQQKVRPKIPKQEPQHRLLSAQQENLNADAAPMLIIIMVLIVE